MNSVIVRPAKKEDISEIMKIIHEAFVIYMENGCLPSPPSALFETADELWHDMKKKCVLVAEYGGCVAGTLRLKFEEDAAYLSRFAVDPTLHRGGIGRILLTNADSEAKKTGCTAIKLHTSLDAKNLVRLYKSHGYSVIGVETDRGYRRAELVKNLKDDDNLE